MKASTVQPGERLAAELETFDAFGNNRGAVIEIRLFNNSPVSIRQCCQACMHVCTRCMYNYIMLVYINYYECFFCIILWLHNFSITMLLSK